MPVTEDGIRYRVYHERARVPLRPEKFSTAEITVESPYGGSTLVHILGAEDEILAVGRADVSPRDRFNRKLGRTIALGRALKEFRRPKEIEIEETGWWELQKEFLDDLMVLAFRETESAGFCYVHFGDAQPASFIVLTPERYDAICRRLFPDGQGVPVGDPEWEHTHVTPEMTSEISSTRIRREASRQREPRPRLPADVTPRSEFGI